MTAGGGAAGRRPRPPAAAAGRPAGRWGLPRPSATAAVVRPYGVSRERGDTWARRFGWKSRLSSAVPPCPVPGPSTRRPPSLLPTGRCAHARVGSWFYQLLPWHDRLREQRIGNQAGTAARGTAPPPPSPRVPPSRFVRGWAVESPGTSDPLPTGFVVAAGVRPGAGVEGGGRGRQRGEASAAPHRRRQRRRTAAVRSPPASGTRAPLAGPSPAPPARPASLPPPPPPFP